MDRNNKMFFWGGILFHINGPWQIPVPYGSKLHIPPTNYHLLGEQKAFVSQTKYWKRFLERKKNKKIKENGSYS